MKVPLAQLLTMTATLASSLAVPSAAFATDTTLAQGAVPWLALTHAVVSARLQPLLQPPLAPASDITTAAVDVRRLLSDEGRAPDCTRPCDAGDDGRPLIADQLLTELGSDPLLGTVMAPVTRGVPITTGDGGPALKFAVIPTQITRGSGLVAIGHF